MINETLSILATEKTLENGRSSSDALDSPGIITVKQECNGVPVTDRLIWDRIVTTDSAIFSINTMVLLKPSNPSLSHTLTDTKS